MIIQTVTTSFKNDILAGLQDLNTDVLYIALYSNLADLGPQTLVYSSTAEVTSPGYAPGGQECQNVTVTTYESTVYISFNNVTWSNVAFTCRGALIYNKTKGNKSIAVLNFGSDKTCTSSFTITLPANTANSALIRV